MRRLASLDSYKVRGHSRNGNPVLLPRTGAGLRDATRYGLILLGNGEEARQRREDLEGQWANRRMSIMPSEFAGLQPSLPSNPSNLSLASIPTLVRPLTAAAWRWSQGPRWLTGIDRGRSRAQTHRRRVL